MKRLEGNVTVVTGGGQGIGYGLVEAFAEAGSNIVITGRTMSKLEKAKEKIEEKYNVKVLPITADGTDEKQVEKALEEVIKEFGKINTIINNAQNSASGVSLVDHTLEDFNKAIYSGLYATFFYMKHGHKYLKETKGSVINFGSGAALSGKEGQSSYAAAKEGIRGLSRVAATEWGKDGVRVNVVCPLVMTEGLIAWSKEYPELYERTIQAVPLGRLGSPKEDIGNVCVFLASDDAAYLTGETLTLQGGSGLRP